MGSPLFIEDDTFCNFSGYGISAQALTAIIRAHDGRGPQTKLTNSILETLGLSSPDELIGYVHLSTGISGHNLHYLSFNINWTQ